MAKVTYNGYTFDSDLEVNYYKELMSKLEQGEVKDFIYHPTQIKNLVGTRSYTPDFIVVYSDRIEVVETKGFNQFSYRIDEQIHNIMLSKNEAWLREYVNENVKLFKKIDFDARSYRVYYKKYKFLSHYGFVDWDFKNPNTIANKRKEKILSQKEEIKELREFKKNALRFFDYWSKQQNNKKLTKQQREWFAKYVLETAKEIK